MWSLSQAISVKVYTMQDYFAVEGEREGTCEGEEQTLKRFKEKAIKGKINGDFY